MTVTSSHPKPQGKYVIHFSKSRRKWGKGKHSHLASAYFVPGTSQAFLTGLSEGYYSKCISPGTKTGFAPEKC